MKKALTSLFILFFLGNLSAQFLNLQRDSLWYQYKKQLFFGFGATQFLGDLGGDDGPGQTRGLGDLDKEAANLEVHLGFRYHFHPLFATSINAYLGKYEASDYYTRNNRRALRQIDIKSTIMELSQRFEFIFYSRYKTVKKKEKLKVRRFEAYLYSGIGLTYFNPQGGNNNYSHPGTFLRPLSTEGQGFPGGTKPYGMFTASIPFGFGFQKSFSRRHSFRMECSYMKTFTDYMDDVSTNYYNFFDHNIAASPDAIFYANPSQDWSMFKDGDPRGGKGKDCYFYASFSFVQALGLKEKKQRPQSQGKW